MPGGTKRNWKSYGHKVNSISENSINILCDPQTSGGLLVAVDANDLNEFKNVMKEFGLEKMSMEAIGRFDVKENLAVMVKE